MGPQLRTPTDIVEAINKGIMQESVTQTMVNAKRNMEMSPTKSRPRAFRSDTAAKMPTFTAYLPTLPRPSGIYAAIKLLGASLAAWSKLKKRSSYGYKQISKKDTSKDE